MSKLFKLLANESLIEEAAKVNEATDSVDSESQTAAVDFDAELEKLKSSQPGESTDGSDTSPESEVSVDGDASENEETTSTDEPKTDESETSDDKTKEVESEEVAPSGDTTPPPENEVDDLQKAVEGINRLTRCMESLKEAHEQGVVSPLAAIVIHGEINAVQADMGLKLTPAPATETLKVSTETGRVEELRVRLMATLKAAWKKLLEWISVVAKWIGETRRAYDARRGKYTKDVEGYRLRLKKMTKVNVGTIEVEDFTFGPLSHDYREDGIEGLNKAIATLVKLNTALTTTFATVSATQADEVRKSVMTVATALSSDNNFDRAAASIKSLDIAGSLKATRSSSSITAIVTDLSYDFKDQNDSGAGSIKFGNIPGGLVLEWAFGECENFGNMRIAVSEVARVGFTTSKVSMPKEQETLKFTPTEIESLLVSIETLMAAGEASSKAMVRLEKLFAAFTSDVKIVSEAFEGIATQVGHDSTNIQDMMRVYTLIINSYEKAVMRPANVLAKAVTASQDTLVRLAGTAMAQLEIKVNDLNKG